MNHQSRLGWGLALVVALTGCTPGYMKASDLESRGQGPSACAKSCEDLGMRMAALVLVGNQLPGCVCQPVHVQGALPKLDAPAPGNAPAPESYNDGAAASTTGYVVIAAAAAARRAQEAQRQAQQNKK